MTDVKLTGKICHIVDLYCLSILLVFVDLPARRDSAGTILDNLRQADVLSVSTNIGLMSMILKYRLTLYFYVTLRQFIN